jgi:hypothetical protein
MDPEVSVRLTALETAMRWHASLGITCPACLMQMAGWMADFLLTQKTTGIPHEGEFVEAPKGKPN